MTLTPYPDDVRVGDTQATAVYCNGQKIWEPLFSSVRVTAALSGVGTLSATVRALEVQAAAAALSGAGTLSATLVVLPPGASFMPAALSGAGSLSTVVMPRLPVDAGLSGDGSLSATLVVVPQGGVAADLSGDGALSATVVPTYAVAAAFSGDGALSAVLAPRYAIAAALSGGGTLSATAVAVPQVPMAAVLSGTGTLSATAVPASAPSVPTPTSSFDWHEGSGTTTASIVSGGYTLTVTDWTIHSGVGAIGPNATVTDWTLALNITVNTLAETAMMIQNNKAQYYNLNGAGHVGIYPDYSTSGPTIPPGAACLVVFTVAGGTTLNAYINGVLVGTWSKTYSLNPSNNFNVMTDSHPSGQVHTLKYWHGTALTATQVAALSSGGSTALTLPFTLPGTI